MKVISRFKFWVLFLSQNIIPHLKQKCLAYFFISTFEKHFQNKNVRILVYVHQNLLI